MTRACHLAVRMATGQVLTDDEIDAMLKRMADRAWRLREDAPTLSRGKAYTTAAQQLTREVLLADLVAKRAEVASKIAREALRRDSDALGAAGLTPAQRLDALTVGSTRQARGAAASTDAEGRAREMSLWGQVQVGVGKMPGLLDRMVNFWGVGDASFDRKIAAEMARLNGAGAVEPTGDDAALHAARVFVSALRAAREMQNGVGAWIDELPGYIARQTHDAEKIAGGYWRELSAMTGALKDGQRLNREAARTRFRPPGARCRRRGPSDRDRRRSAGRAWGD